MGIRLLPLSNIYNDSKIRINAYVSNVTSLSLDLQLLRAAGSLTAGEGI